MAIVRDNFKLILKACIAQNKFLGDRKHNTPLTKSGLTTF